MEGLTEVGFYGKLPCRGDFLQRRVSQDFVDVWDAWLQESLHETRKRLDEAWLNTYLTGPVWRFGLSAGVCGEHTYIGILVPSVDRVGRYFPLTPSDRAYSGRTSACSPSPAIAAIGSRPPNRWCWMLSRQRRSISTRSMSRLRYCASVSKPRPPRRARVCCACWRAALFRPTSANGRSHFRRRQRCKKRSMHWLIAS